jgi:acetyl esterase/lipase
MLTHLGLSGAKTFLWNVGITKITKEMEDAILTNNHTLLVEDANLRKKYQEYLDINFIPNEYKKGKSYYDGYNSETVQNFVYPKILNENSILKKDKNLAVAIQKLLTPEASPLLANDDLLKSLPKAYFAVVEWDALKDQALIYAGRLRANGVPVDIDFYEGGFHGIANYVMKKHGYKVGHEILDGIVKFVKTNINV